MIREVAPGAAAGETAAGPDIPHTPVIEPAGTADVRRTPIVETANGTLSDETYRVLFAALDEGFCILEVLFDASRRATDFRFLEANAAFERLTGLRDVIGRRMRELAPDIGEDWFEAYGRVAMTGGAQRFELRAEALRHWYDVYAFRFGDPSLCRVAVIFSDISERKSNEAALRESERRFRTLAADREALLSAERKARLEADRAMRARDDILATLSHELRTPLASIVTWARLLQKQFLRDEDTLRKGLSVIGDNAMSLGKLISDLLDSSRIACGKFALDEEVFDLPELIGSVCATLRPAAAGKGVALECDVDVALPPVLADASRLRQVMLNLISNAIKFTPEGGHIRLSLRRADGQFMIQVQDDGEGIDRDFLPHLFHRFSQAEGVRDRRRGGLGLGLSIARQIIEMHGGSIHAHSDGRGQGACFTVVLPGQLAERAARLPAALRAGSVGVETLEGVRVLAVEDQPDMHELLRRVLADHRARVEVVRSADEALALLRNPGLAGHFDVLVSDIGLPAMDGNRLIRIVREELGLDARVLPAVAVSAYARQEDRQQAITAGYQAYVTKPYDVVALIHLLRELTSASQG